MARRRGWGGRRKGAGRKKFAPADLRSRAILVRLTEAEIALIEYKADGQPLGAWLRELGLRARRGGARERGR